MKNKDIDYAGIDYKALSKGILSELETAGGSADETAVAKLQQQKAELDKQIAALGVKKAAIMKQIDALEKK
jgi:hypothetical protein